MIQYDPMYEVLVDEQGILLPKTDVELLKEQIEKHLAHSKLELEAIARHTVEDKHPNMASQFNWEYFE